MKIIHVTDTHIRRPGERIYGLDPAERLAAVVDDVRRRHLDADLFVITGDLADAGERDAYAHLSELLSPLRIPIRLMLGNHDRRAPFLDVFDDVDTDENGFVQSVIDPPDVGRLIFLDTLQEGMIGGMLCADRLGWLEARLREVEEQPVTLFLHHPPLPVGVPHFEPICMPDPEPFLDVLAGHPGGVRHLFVGHLHLAFTGSVRGGLPITAARSSNHLMGVDFIDSGARWLAGSPAYNVILMDADSIFVHALDRLHDAQIGYGKPCVGP